MYVKLFILGVTNVFFHIRWCDGVWQVKHKFCIGFTTI